MELDLDHLELLPSDLLECVKKSVDIIEKAFELFSVQQLALSFNGGKDCSVLLHLIHSVLLRREKLSKSSSSSQKLDFFKDKSISNCVGDDNDKKNIETENLKFNVGVSNPAMKTTVNPLLAIYFDTPNIFPEEYEFTLQTSHRYGLNLIVIPCKTIKEGTKFLPSNTKAVFVGSRKTDPYCENLIDFSPTDSDKGWAPFMRVNALLHWTYKEVWSFINYIQLPYCSLYDSGYTSIGSQLTTKPNPNLLKEGKYEPAHTLIDGETERDGR